jgi:glutamate/tyrosine decarboxylase-like PLP-dependent enzyme
MSGKEPQPPLTLSPEAMRRLGYRVIDLLVDHWEKLPQEPVVRVLSRAEAKAALAEPPPQEGRDPEEVLARLTERILPYVARVHHPRFFAFVPGPSNFVSVLGDALATGFNVFAGTWLGGSAASEVELVTVDWLRQLVGFPEDAGGLFLSGGSMANLTGLLVARKARLDDDPATLARATAYFSDQTHSSVERAFRVLGIPDAGQRRIPCDGERRLSLPALAAAVEADRRAGRVPFAVVANAGTTNTGAVDPLPELAAFCRAHGLWLHADGAYGAATVLCDEGREALAGLDQADSLSLDPHKWLFQPFELGCVLVRDRRLLPTAFAVHPEHLKDLDLGLGEVHFSDHGIQLSRSFRALKLWLSVQVFGLGAFRDAVARGFELARRAQELLEESGAWRIVTPARLGVVTFRYGDLVPGSDAAEEGYRRFATALREDGYTFLTTTRLDGATVLRLCTINPRTTDADLVGTVERLTAVAERVLRPVRA